MKKLGRFLYLIVIAVSTMFSILLTAKVLNKYLDNNLIFEKIGEMQEFASLVVNDCNYDLDVRDGVLYLDDIFFKSGFGKCFQDVQGITKIEIDKVYGGRITEGRIFAKFIKENKIPVHVIDQCNSACTDVLLHSPKRTVCADTVIGIHSADYLIKDIPIIGGWYGDLKQDALTNAYLNTNINIDFLREKEKETSHETIYTPTIKEMLDNNIITEKPKC